MYTKFQQEYGRKYKKKTTIGSRYDLQFISQYLFKKDSHNLIGCFSYPYQKYITTESLSHLSKDNVSNWKWIILLKLLSSKSKWHYLFKFYAFKIHFPIEGEIVSQLSAAIQLEN